LDICAILFGEWNELLAPCPIERAGIPGVFVQGDPGGVVKPYKMGFYPCTI
jgi:hypothetical protein